MILPEITHESINRLSFIYTILSSRTTSEWEDACAPAASSPPRCGRPSDGSPSGGRAGNVAASIRFTRNGGAEARGRRHSVDAIGTGATTAVAMSAADHIVPAPRAGRRIKQPLKVASAPGRGECRGVWPTHPRSASAPAKVATRALDPRMSQGHERRKSTVDC